MPSEIKFEDVSDLFGAQMRKLQAAHGNKVLRKFPTTRDAKAYMESEGITDWVAYGLRSKGFEWFQIRPKDDEGKVGPVRLAHKGPNRQQAPRTPGAPTAKSLCLSVWTPGMERDAFVAAAVALGVKEVTAKTMYSDIKAGRIK
jgi:hypothetical protein